MLVGKNQGLAGRATREQLQQDDTERVDVGLGGECVAGEGGWINVLGRADNARGEGLNRSLVSRTAIAAQ